MCVQDSEKALHNAVAAAKQYVKLKKECRDRHEAFIGVSVNLSLIHISEPTRRS